MGNRNISDVILWFSRFTSIGGLAQARGSDNKCSRYIWILLFITGCVFTIHGVTTSISNYLEYRSVTTVSKEYKSVLTFPSVTICNLNMVHCGNLHSMITRCEKVWCFNTLNVRLNYYTAVLVYIYIMLYLSNFFL